MISGDSLILKILLCLAIPSLFLLKTEAKRVIAEENNKRIGSEITFDIDPPLGDDPNVNIVLGETIEQDKKNVSRVRSPQLIPGRGELRREGKKQRRGHKKHRKYQNPSCPPGEFYHLRGKRCVPQKCPEGSYGRNSNTGECAVTIGHEESNPGLMGFSGKQKQTKSRQIAPRFGYAIGDRIRRPYGYWTS